LSPLDDGVLQTTSHVIGAGEMYTAQFHVASIAGIGALDLTVYAFETGQPIATRTPLAVETVQITSPNAWGEHTFSYVLDDPLAVGQNLGIEFNNALETTSVYFDNVELTVAVVPEPSTLALAAVALAFMAALQGRSRRRHGT
jgi:hypothetical protein